MITIEYITRAIVERNGKFLLCRGRGRENWFFPGGHIEEGESALDVLGREIQEELGEESNVRGFLGACENKFEIKGKTIHEINLVFEVELVNRGELMSKEDHLEFAWFTREEMKNLLVFPLALRDTILANTANKTPLWASEGFK